MPLRFFSFLTRRRPSRIPTAQELGYAEAMSKEQLASFPDAEFRGNIHLIQNPEDVPKATKLLRHHKALGFDTESRPSFRRGQNFPVAILQLATEKDAFIFQLKKTGLPDPLLDILASPKIIKTGVALDQDVIKLRELRNFEPAGFVDVGRIAGRIGIKTTGLRNLAGIFLGVRISKSAQRSNWANPNLSPNQITYAATDAWISLKLWKILSRIPLPPEPPAEKNNSQTASPAGEAKAPARPHQRGHRRSPRRRPNSPVQPS